MEIKKVCVIGGGTMGRQIALNSAIYGYNTVVTDAIEDVCKNVEAWEQEYLQGRIAKGRMTEGQVKEIKARFAVIPKLEDAVSDANLIIEAIIEDEAAKKKLFQQVSEYAPKDAIICTNSSFMVSSQFAECVGDPSRLLNCHFYNPALVMKFVEVVQGEHTSPEIAQLVYDYCKKVGKEPILMKKEIEGFAANRIMRVVTDEVFFMIENGYCTPEEMDAACELGLNHPMGPFRLMDLVGIDVNFQVMKDRLAKSGIKPNGYDILEKMVAEKRLGRKSGKGFYDYSK